MNFLFQKRRQIFHCMGCGVVNALHRQRTAFCVKIKKIFKYIKRGFQKEGNLLAYEDDLRQIDGQHRDFVVLTEFW